MEKIIETLKDYAIQVIKSDIDPKKRYILQKALLEALDSLEYAQWLCNENKIKLGD